ncbi:MAG TPA: MBL fold metallo-hydrolase [Candidatus Dormibacteraeota bacterium]|nr:MBL fold metallo-hydrolase [Candidatus Dormibacteraeota bacterium]
MSARAAGGREGPLVRILRAPELGNSSFLVADPDAGEAIVIDPFRDVEPYLESAESLGLELTRTLETHLHNDFISGARELESAAGVSRDPLEPGVEARVGRYTVTALPTPGHTPDHLSYLVADDGRPLALFSGGALMVGAIARTDLFGPHLAVHLALEAYRTVRVRLRGLPDDVAVYPTHGGGSFCGAATSTEAETTLGRERRDNPFLTTDELLPFIARALHQGRYPAYYREMAGLNSRGIPLLGRTLPALPELKPFQVESAMREKGAAVVDVRPAREYDDEHIPGSYNVGINGPVSAWVGWIIERSRPLVLAGGSQRELADAHRQLLRIGYDGVIGALEGGVGAWRAAGLPISRFEVAEIEDLASWVLSAEPMTVVDVRDEDEWTHGHVPGAVHLYVPDVAHHAHELPAEAPIAVHCASGYRAGIAASILERAGFSRIIHVAAEWSDWDRLHLATTAPG